MEYVTYSADLHIFSRLKATQKGNRSFVNGKLQCWLHHLLVSPTMTDKDNNNLSPNGVKSLTNKPTEKGAAEIH
jgi:uncharacterized protein involved in high-affinity Fe2+ transport